MSWKHILYAVIGALIPFGYSAVTGQFPDFPLGADVFSALIIWVVGLAIGGWQLNKFVLVNTRSLTVPVAKGVYAHPDMFDPLPLLKAILAALSPIIWQLIVGWNDAFPLAQTDFINVLLWIVGLLFGGGSVAKAVYVGQKRITD